jgi:hypothetical protein
MPGIFIEVCSSAARGGTFRSSPGSSFLAVRGTFSVLLPRRAGHLAENNYLCPSVKLGVDVLDDGTPVSTVLSYFPEPDALRRDRPPIRPAN